MSTNNNKNNMNMEFIDRIKREINSTVIDVFKDGREINIYVEGRNKHTKCDNLMMDAGYTLIDYNSYGDGSAWRYYQKTNK